MPRKGYLSPRSFFPSKGDVLDEILGEGDGISWECVRAHAWPDPRSGTTITYAFLVGRHAELGNQPIPLFVDSTQGMEKFMARFDVIHRENRAGVRVTYKRLESGAFEEV